MRSLVHGRWIESQEQTDYNKYDKLSTGNAKSYWTKKDGYKRSQTPKVGAIGCYSGGKSGAGHVLFVEEVKSNGDIVTSNSAYNGTRFYLKTLTKKSGYKYSSIHNFQGFILSPVDYSDDDVTPTVERDENKDQLKVITTELRVRCDHSTDSAKIGVAEIDGLYNFYEIFKDDKYTWYRIADNQWIADNGNWLEVFPKKEDPDKDAIIEQLEKDIENANKHIVELEEELKRANEEIIKLTERIEELEQQEGCNFKYEAPKTGEYQIHLNEGETLYIK